MLLGFKNTTVRLVRDIELKYSQSGTAVGSSSIVSSRKWKDKNSNELMEEVCFIDITAFGHTAEYMNQYFKKGSLITIDADLVQEKWETKDGDKRSKHSLRVQSVDFSMCGKGESGGGEYSPKEPNEYGQPVQKNSGQGQQTQSTEQATVESQIPEIDIDEDEIPF